MAIYAKKVSVGSFLEKGVDIKDSDLITVANEGKDVEGQFGTQHIFLVKTATKEGNVAFNQTSLNALIDAYGVDSKNWIGKQVKVWAILSNVQGKMTKVYYFTHPSADIDDDGNFKAPKTGPTAPEATPEAKVTLDQIPF